MSHSSDLLNRRRQVVADGVGFYNTATVSSAKGAIVVDCDGAELLDFAGGIGVLNAGHCPQPVVRAIQEQASRYIHASFNVFTYEPYVALCEKLVQLFPHGDRTKAMLVSTGAEAVENAVKIARQATGRPAVLCFGDGYHGRTMMAMTLTSNVAYKLGCGPFAPEIYRLPFPNYYRDGNGRSIDQFVRDHLRLLRESLKSMVARDQLAAVIIELVQGEGGFNVAPEQYILGLRDFCTVNGIVLIIDEIQTGFCRTGQWASWQGYGITPDLSTFAKSMGSGMPIAAVVGRQDVMDAARPGTIGGTFIGNPVCCAAALATIQYMQENDLNQRATDIGSILIERLLALKQRTSSIGDVRGRGAMVALEFVKQNDPNQPDPGLCNSVISSCAQHGLIVISAGTYKNVIRILCPLVITNEQLARGMDILEQAVTAS